MTFNYARVERTHLGSNFEREEKNRDLKRPLKIVLRNPWFRQRYLHGKGVFEKIFPNVTVVSFESDLKQREL